MNKLEKLEAEISNKKIELIKLIKQELYIQSKKEFIEFLERLKSDYPNRDELINSKLKELKEVN